MVSSFSRKTLLSRVIVFFLVTFFLWLSVFNYTINTNDRLQDEIINEFLHDHHNDQQGSQVGAAARKIITKFKSKHKMLSPNLRNDTTIQLGLMYDVLAESAETTTTTTSASSLGLLQELVRLAESDISTTTSTQSNVMNLRKLVESNVNRLRRERIRNMTLHAWNGYRKYAWGKNELKPLSKQPNEVDFLGHTDQDLGLTIVDSLDTLLIMNLTEQFDEAAEWVRQNFTINVDSEMSVFEVNIRYVGGFLSAYTLTSDQLFLDKAVEVANKIMKAFDTPTGIPVAKFNPKNEYTTNKYLEYESCIVLAELGTLSLEFKYLTQLTGNKIYQEKVDKIYEVVEKAEKKNGLYFESMNPVTGKWCSQRATFGGGSDSFYEYLFKVWLLGNRTDDRLLDTYIKAMDAVVLNMLKKSSDGFNYLGKFILNNHFDPSMDHLACFAGGLFALTTLNVPEHSATFENLALELTKTCHHAYTITRSHLGPESFAFDYDNRMRVKNKMHILRPETIESYFYMWRLTKDERYREWAWQAAVAIDTNCRTENGYAGLKDVNKRMLDDVQQSFFLAETLKYLYLIFSDDDLLPLDKYVFNTEAHPFLINFN